MTALKKWWNDEPVATRVGPLIVLIAGYLVYRGVIDETTQELIIGIAAILLGGGAVAVARAKVSPLAKLTDAALDLIRPDKGDHT
ncbi:hypothetical protein IU447_24190 [Nocardia farcinica]|uniref:hypothetical protein n=1 Tax=Nocardia farcinica TaxID=37329 RepID=UPI001896135E|nr:hypothetical protein [Nocardia farcinica]MBF6363220.1 hypothetical protein [Nocardia farcinica]